MGNTKVSLARGEQLLTMTLINGLYIMYISTCELWKISIAITSIIMICCLVEEGPQWFFLYLKLCLEIHCHNLGIFC